jgi:hypothetical protein
LPTPLPIFERTLGLTPLPLFKSAVLVMQSELPARQPPLDGPAKRGALAPAVRVARALSVTRIVDALQKTSRHTASIRRRGRDTQIGKAV